MNPLAGINLSTLFYEAQVQHDLDTHWGEVARKNIREKREELKRKMKELDTIESDFESLQFPHYAKSMACSDKVKNL